jgi:hypothetical protein
VSNDKCSGNTMLTAAQFVAPPGGIPNGTIVSWSIKLEVLTPGTNLNINWAIWTRAFNVTELNYSATGAKTGDDNAFGSSLQAAYPTNYGSAVAGGSNGSLSGTRALACACS